MRRYAGPCNAPERLPPHQSYLGYTIVTRGSDFREGQGIDGIGDEYLFELMIIAITAATVGAAFGIFSFKELIFPLQTQTEYAGLRLGMSMEEVNYVNGIPDAVLGPLEEEGEFEGWQTIINVKDFDKRQHVEEFDDWSFDQPLRRIDLTFDKDKHLLIAIQCYSSDRNGRCPAIGGIKDGNSEQSILDKLGKPNISKIEGISKQIDYTTLGVQFYLTQQTVYLLGIHDKRYVYSSKTPK
jgi:hypothetical protein